MVVWRNCRLVALKPKITVLAHLSDILLLIIRTEQWAVTYRVDYLGSTAELSRLQCFFLNVDKQLCSQGCVKEPKQVNNLNFCKFGLSKVCVQLRVAWMHCLTAVSQHYQETEPCFGGRFTKRWPCRFPDLFYENRQRSLLEAQFSFMTCKWSNALIGPLKKKKVFLQILIFIVECLIVNDWSKWKAREINQNTYN